MYGKPVLNRSLQKLLITLGPALVLLSLVLAIGYKCVDPAPLSHFVISTSDGEGDYQ